MIYLSEKGKKLKMNIWKLFVTNAMTQMKDLLNDIQCKKKKKEKRAITNYVTTSLAFLICF